MKNSIEHKNHINRVEDLLRHFKLLFIALSSVAPMPASSISCLADLTSLSANTVRLSTFEQRIIIIINVQAQYSLRNSTIFIPQNL
tara:strand:- start:5064 stop:5321 length:258 start_codon:yes stop_codon:yes gene_type:complete